MKTLFNLTTSPDDLERFRDTADFLSLLDGFDGVELSFLGEDARNILPKEKVVGFHMGYFTCWLDFWNQNEAALLKEFGSRPVWKRYYGGAEPKAIVERYRKDLKLARWYGAEYVVFHLSEATIEETFTFRYRHRDEEVIDAAAQILNQLFADEDGSLILLMENLWQPGLTFTRPEMTRRLLEQVEYPNKGIMLDTGHLLHTDFSLRTQEEGLSYIRRMLSEHGDLCRWIKGVHLHQSLTGEYCEKTQKNPPALSAGHAERQAQMFWHAFAVDQHLPFTCSGVDDLIEAIAPEYLTFEFITTGRAQHEDYLARQRQALKRIL